jgi:outer membrane protein, heavy metal efflux system
MDHSKTGLVVCLALALVGCATRHYHAEPISPVDSASRLQARNLEDEQLRDFIQQNLRHEISPWPPQSWNLDLLTLAAFYFNPDLEMARDRLAAAQAAVITAGARPNPDIRIAPGYETSPESPWLFAFSLDFPIETAGKRGHHVEQARNLSNAVRFELAETAWGVRSRVRTAVLDHLLAVRELNVLEDQQRILTERSKLLEARLRVGEIPRPELDTAQVELSHLRLELNQARGRVPETQAALAAAIGLPSSALSGVQVSWPSLERPPAEQQVSADAVERDAVLNRLDVQRTLAEYAAADAALKLEIAKQYPDLHLGPGYDFDEGHHKFSLGVGLTLPLFNRNQGPIAEAEAHRKEAGALFLATQAHVISDSEAALARYQAALAELREAEESLTKLQSEREQMTRRAVQAGEADQLALNGMVFQAANAARARLDALRRAQTALGTLEDALQKPLEPGTAMPPLPQSAARDLAKKEGTR